MLTYENLSSEKYWIESARQELKAHRKGQNKAAVRSLFHFLFAVAMVFFVLFAVQTMPMWLPIVSERMTTAADQVQQFMSSVAY